MCRVVAMFKLLSKVYILYNPSIENTLSVNSSPILEDFSSAGSSRCILVRV